MTFWLGRDYGTAIAYCSALIRPSALAILLIQQRVAERTRHGQRRTATDASI
jgi:hypothetical protein